MNAHSPAFPRSGSDFSRGEQPGISVWDYFYAHSLDAALELARELSNSDTVYETGDGQVIHPTDSMSPGPIAALAAEFADAMSAERTRRFR